MGEKNHWSDISSPLAGSKLNDSIGTKIAIIFQTLCAASDAIERAPTKNNSTLTGDKLNSVDVVVLHAQISS